jgi:hypothetical protein
MRLKNQLFSKYGLTCSPRKESPRKLVQAVLGIPSEEIFMGEL